MPTYTADSSLIPIPERGWFYYSECHLKSDNTGYTPLDPTALANARTGTTTINGYTFPGQTLVFRYFFMEDAINSDTLPSAWLTKVGNDLAALRTAGVKGILRFAYSPNDSNDTPLSRTLQHQSQIATVVNQYADVVDSIECGMIGRWGEWYYTANYGDSGNVTAQNISDRNAVIQRWLQALDSRIFVLLRYVGSRQTYLNSTQPNPGGDAVRLGLHNDAFLSPYADYGTYTTFSSQSESFNRTYVANLASVPNGHESAGGGGDTSYATAKSELIARHWTFINPNYVFDIVSSWGQSGIDEINQKLGHRLRLVSASIPSSSNAGAQQTASVVIVNDGWTAPVRNRPVQLILDKGSGSPVVAALPIDIRSLQPGQQTTVSVTFNAPTSSGTYNAYLYLPDPSASLQSRADYALRLANTSMWDSSTGRHNLASSMAVTGSGTTLTTTSGSGFFAGGQASAKTVAVSTSAGALALTSKAAAPSGLLKGVLRMQVNGVMRIVKLTGSTTGPVTTSSLTTETGVPLTNESGVALTI